MDPSLNPRHFSQPYGLHGIRDNSPIRIEWMAELALTISQSSTPAYLSQGAHADLFRISFGCTLIHLVSSDLRGDASKKGWEALCQGGGHLPILVNCSSSLLKVVMLQTGDDLVLIGIRYYWLSSLPI